ncbi:MAG: hypothetical protein R2883_00840 [Caldisericia bacterium]
MKKSGMIIKAFVVFSTIFVCLGNAFISAEQKLVLDDPKPEVVNATAYVEVSGTMPQNSTLFLNDIEAQTYGRINLSVPLQKAPSNNPVLIEVFDKSGNMSESGIFNIENTYRYKISCSVGSNVWNIDGVDRIFDAIPKKSTGWRTLIPIEPIASEVFGAKTSYDAEHGILTVEYNGVTTKHYGGHENLAIIRDVLYVNDGVYRRAFGLEFEMITHEDEIIYVFSKDTHPEKKESDVFSVLSLVELNPSVSEAESFEIIGDIPAGFEVKINGETANKMSRFNANVPLTLLLT